MKTIKFLFCLVLLASSLSQAAITYVHTDHLGSVVAESNQTGQITRRFHYKPFGETIETQQDDVGYTGHKHDTDLGLTYMQARYYDPVLGRFYGNDPVGFVAKSPVHSFGRYAYVNNNPYKYTDPSGMIGHIVYGAIAGAAGGFVGSSGGTLKQRITGTLAGLVAGAGAAAAFAPMTSHLTGMSAGAAAAGVGAVASTSGQAIGSVTTAAMENGIENVKLSDVKVDATTTAAGALGAGVASQVAKGVALVTATRPIIGNTLQVGGTPTAVGATAGAVVEGTIIGAAEGAAPEVKEGAAQLVKDVRCVTNQNSCE